MRALLLAAMTAAAVLVLGACGGEDKEADAPTRAQFITRTDKLCEASNRRTRTLNRQLTRAAAGANSDREMLSRLAPILERGYGRVRDNAIAFRTTDPPAGDTTRIERIRKLYDRQAEFVSKLAAAARRGDTAAFASMSKQQRQVVVRARRLTRAYGFKECGSRKSDAP